MFDGVVGGEVVEMEIGGEVFEKGLGCQPLVCLHPKVNITFVSKQFYFFFSFFEGGWGVG